LQINSYLFCFFSWTPLFFCEGLNSPFDSPLPWSLPLPPTRLFHAPFMLFPLSPLSLCFLDANFPPFGSPIHPTKRPPFPFWKRFSPPSEKQLTTRPRVWCMRPTFPSPSKGSLKTPLPEVFFLSQTISTHELPVLSSPFHANPSFLLWSLLILYV